MAAAVTRQFGLDLIGTYLKDHLAGATGGVELARRAAGAVRDPVARATLQRLAAEIAQDRAALLEIMAVLSVPVRSRKVYAAWVGEKAARLKLKGHLLARSPLGSLEELEMMRLDVEGKAAGWRNAAGSGRPGLPLDTARLDELIARARRQADLLEELRVRARWIWSSTGRPQPARDPAPRWVGTAAPGLAPQRRGREAAAPMRRCL
jgi:hypothetical protein